MNCLGFTLGHLRAERAKELQWHVTEEMRMRKELAEGTVALQQSFISHMTHELRTPLNAVIAFNSLCLEGGGLNHQDEEYIRSSLTSGQQLLGVVNQASHTTRNPLTQRHRGTHPQSVSPAAQMT